MTALQGANSSEEYQLHSRKIIKILDANHSCQILYLPNPSAYCNTWKNTVNGICLCHSCWHSGIGLLMYFWCLPKKSYKTPKQRFLKHLQKKVLSNTVLHSTNFLISNVLFCYVLCCVQGICISLVWTCWVMSCPCHSQVWPLLFLSHSGVSQPHLYCWAVSWALKVRHSLSFPPVMKGGYFVLFKRAKLSSKCGCSQESHSTQYED